MDPTTNKIRGYISKTCREGEIEFDWTQCQTNVNVNRLDFRKALKGPQDLNRENGGQLTLIQWIKVGQKKIY